MIKLIFNKTKDNRVIAISASGHAKTNFNCSQNIVCAGFSALLISGFNSLKNIYQHQINIGHDKKIITNNKLVLQVISYSVNLNTSLNFFIQQLIDFSNLHAQDVKFEIFFSEDKIIHQNSQRFLTCNLQHFASKKGGGSTVNGRDSAAKRLGIKIYDGQTVKPGQIIYRQRGTKILAGPNVGLGTDHSLFALKSGILRYRHLNKFKKMVTIVTN